MRMSWLTYSFADSNVGIVCLGAAPQNHDDNVKNSNEPSARSQTGTTAARTACDYSESEFGIL